LPADFCRILKTVYVDLNGVTVLARSRLKEENRRSRRSGCDIGNFIDIAAVAESLDLSTIGRKRNTYSRDFRLAIESETK